MPRAGTTGVAGQPALTGSYQTYFDALVDGKASTVRVRNTGGVDIQVRVTPHHVTPANSDFNIPIGESELFRGRTAGITKLEIKGNTGAADFGAVEV